MKILLDAINLQYIHSNLAVRYLWSFTKDLPYESKIREFSINEIEEKFKSFVNSFNDVFNKTRWNTTCFFKAIKGITDVFRGKKMV